MSLEESRAVRKASREAAKDAEKKVKAEYAKQKKALQKELREAEKSIKDAQQRIQKALGSEKKGSGTRAKKGERDTQFVAYVKAHPGSRLADISRGIGLSGSAANGVAKRVVKEGKVKKAADKTYTVK
ncbi:MAG: hypothetical protein V9E96_20570 [Chitinophagaceae bacterium]